MSELSPISKVDKIMQKIVPKLNHLYDIGADVFFVDLINNDNTVLNLFLSKLTTTGYKYQIDKNKKELIIFTKKD